MEVSVTFRHVEPTPALKEYATEKVARICSKYLRTPLEASVILSVSKQRHLAEINVHAKHFDISAHETTADLYSAIDLALDKLEAQLRKHKDRINHHKGIFFNNDTVRQTKLFGPFQFVGGPRGSKCMCTTSRRELDTCGSNS